MHRGVVSVTRVPFAFFAKWVVTKGIVCQPDSEIVEYVGGSKYCRVGRCYQKEFFLTEEEAVARGAQLITSRITCLERQIKRLKEKRDRL